MLVKIIPYRKLITFTSIVLLCFQASTSSIIDSLVPENSQQINYSFSPIIKKTAGAVVNIYANKRVRVSTFSPFMNDPFFSQFFNDDIFQYYSKERLQNSLGSGVIISKDGLIITNYHVIEGAEGISIVLGHNKDYKANVVVVDKEHDLALLKCQELTKIKDLKFLELGDSDNMEVGDLVLAIGNPYGIGKTVTSGIISGPEKSSSTGRIIGDDFLQTDAAINPGNSGGALVNIKGELIGINTAIYTQSGGSQGLGFAIPSNIVKSFLQNADLTQGKLLVPWSGIKAIDIDANMQDALNLNHTGIIIKSMHKESPFAKAGLHVEDIIITIDNKPIIGVRDFNRMLYNFGINKKVHVEYIRNKKNYRTELMLKPAPLVPSPNHTKITTKSLVGGTTVANLSPAIGEDLNIDLDNIAKIMEEYANIVVINSVDKGSIAANFGLRPGDIILEYNKTKITSIEQLKQVISKVKVNERHFITILRNNSIIRIAG